MEVAESNGTVFATPLRGQVNTVVLAAKANRTGTIISNVMAGRSVNAAAPAGTVLYVLGVSTFTIGLAPGSSGDFGGLTGITIGSAAGVYMGVVCVMSTSGKWVVTPMAAIRT